MVSHEPEGIDKCKPFKTHYEQLAHFHASTPARRGRPPTGLPLGEISVCPEVFQPRLLDRTREAVQASRDHIRHLAESGFRNGKLNLDPIRVIRIGDDWVVVDGFHRLSAMRLHAHRRSKATKDFERSWAQALRQTIPVRVHTGSFEEAVHLSGKANSKARLQMTQEERRTFVFRARIRKLSGISKSHPSVSQLARDAGVSERTAKRVSSMARKVFDKKVIELKEGELCSDKQARLGAGHEMVSWESSRARVYLTADDRLQKDDGCFEDPYEQAKTDADTIHSLLLREFGPRYRFERALALAEFVSRGEDRRLSEFLRDLVDISGVDLSGVQAELREEAELDAALPF